MIIKPKKEIEAIHKHDLEAMLSNLGLLDDFNASKLQCQFCHDVIHENNFGAVYSEEKKIKFSCSKLQCLSNLPNK